MIRLKRPHSHTHNSVERPQNRHLKPFKSRRELNGQLDPRINIGGRPKSIREETAAWLEETDRHGVTNARKVVESVGKLACSGRPGSVAAFKVLHEMVQPTTLEAEQDARRFTREIYEAIWRQAAQPDVFDFEEEPPLKMATIIENAGQGSASASSRLGLPPSASDHKLAARLRNAS